VTGAHYATTFVANCIVMDGGTLAFGADGRPVIRAVALDAQQVSILPVWDPTGLRGTGSDDFEVRDVFVPEQRSFSVANSPPRESGALYRLALGTLTELSVTAVAIGIARHALDAFADLTHRKKISGLGTPLADDPGVQVRFAEAYATWRLARAGVYSLAQQAWEVALANRALSASEASEITAGCVLSVAKLRGAVGELVALTGMTGLQPDDELARAWRDLQGVAAHVAVSGRHLTMSGATLLSA
jgi:indole-3-acetate monooxygenase